jgi:hypothetical protein
MSHDQRPARDAMKETEAAPEGGGLRLFSRRVRAPESGGDDFSRLTATARARLVRALLIKGTLDVLFVAALAVAAHYVAFRPSFRGAFDRADARVAAGWVVDRTTPGRPVEVQLYVDGVFVAGGLADLPRPDVAAAGRAPHERVGFVFRFETPLRPGSEARVYAVTISAGGARRTLRQIGNALPLGAG